MASVTTVSRTATGSSVPPPPRNNPPHPGCHGNPLPSQRRRDHHRAPRTQRPVDLRHLQRSDPARRGYTSHSRRRQLRTPRHVRHRSGRLATCLQRAESMPVSWLFPITRRSAQTKTVASEECMRARRAVCATSQSPDTARGARGHNGIICIPGALRINPLLLTAGVGPPPHAQGEKGAARGPKGKETDTATHVRGCDRNLAVL